MQPEKDLRQRTKKFALQIIRLFSELPKTTEAQDWQTGSAIWHIGRGELPGAYRARSRAEFIAKCGDSLRELENGACREAAT